MNACLLAPEIGMALLALAFFLETLGYQALKPLRGAMVWMAGGVALLALLALGARGNLFSGVYVVDALSQYFKLAVALGFAVVTAMGPRPASVEEDKRPDYFMLLAVSALGLMLLASSAELTTMYLSLELASLSLYAVAPLRAGSRAAAEAGVKYILYGAMVTALALYGLSLVMAAQHTTYLAELATKPWSVAQAPLAVLGLSLYLCGFLFKLALFPFHFWCPDVYQGVGNETAAFVSTLPKLGAVAVLVRLVGEIGMNGQLASTLAVLAALSMTAGNLSALVQRDLKRMLGYSSVSHAGFAVMGLVAGGPEGLASATFYAACYLLMNLAAFFVICRLDFAGENPTLESLDGLSKRSPGSAFVLLVAAFSLVGLPPTAGFTGKFFLLGSLWGRGHDWLVIVAVLNTAVAIYYYLNMVRHAYTAEPAEVPAGAPEPALLSRPRAWLGGSLAALLLAAGLYPAPLFDMALAAARLATP
ncbi:NADH-quinone oxidoreductase subunit N [Fundidesulfovibrio magnetotacticus]|uniref:NADH-quinone oxidoreductase subunit N n=1 Tax=Fundidesulfovibrio magnetotacticus TaxID=2730080 RepID=A0A6V8LWA2_9BACT|nr:NADH-quinone oxidoreductase subunit N [Fundidesulfovibrio magnetotacticus]GFK92555.1 NADH-quinone oxidoreductase subunit N [Fundidesulfovibrio magnetotacticus]